MADGHTTADRWGSAARTPPKPWTVARRLHETFRSTRVSTVLFLSLSWAEPAGADDVVGSRLPFAAVLAPVPVLVPVPMPLHRAVSVYYSGEAWWPAVGVIGRSYYRAEAADLRCSPRVLGEELSHTASYVAWAGGRAQIADGEEGHSLRRGRFVVALGASKGIVLRLPGHCPDRGLPTYSREARCSVILYVTNPWPRA